MQLSDDQKFQVLIAELEERYSASHKIRERSSQFTLWISGMAIGLAWVLINGCILSVGQRVSLTVFTLALSFGALFLLRGLLRGAATNRTTMARVEEALGLYEKGVFLPDDAVLSAAYRRPQPAKSHDCCTLVVWLYVVSISLIAVIWTAPYPHNQENQLTQNETGGSHD